MTDNDGTLTETYTYDAFGTLTYIQSLNEEGVLAQTDTALSRFLYAGEQYDEVSGLYYLRARRYDTTVGRFTQEDTYLGDGRNLYVYVQNNPLKYVDPSGYSKKCGGDKKNTFWDAILQGAVISSQMADSYSGQLGRDWGNYVAPTVQEDPLGSARDTAIGVVETLSPVPTGLDKYVEHQDMYLTGMILAMPFGGAVDDAIEYAGKTAIRKGAELVGNTKKAINGASELAETSRVVLNITDDISSSDTIFKVDLQMFAEDLPKIGYDVNQQAVIELAKEVERRGGTTEDVARILLDWADEYKVPFHDIEIHPNRPGAASKVWHFHIGRTGHIPVTDMQ